MNEAVYAVRIIGGVNATARALGIQPAVVSKWLVPRDRGGSGGIPRRWLRPILNLAKEKNLPITAEDLIFGKVLE